MIKRLGTVLSSLVCKRILLVCVFLSFPISLLHALEIHIRVMSGNSGKPITNDCVDVFVPGIVKALVIPTDKLGIAVLHVEGEHAESVTASTVKACGGLATVDPTVGSADSISISSDYYVLCQEYRKVFQGEPTAGLPENRAPSYSIKRVLESGVAAGNTCGDFRITAKPGELIIFVRPLHWWEKMRR